MTLARQIKQWAPLWVFTLGLVLMMFGARPELQPRPHQPEALGPTITMVGHGVAWPAAAVLAVRVLRQVRAAQQPNAEVLTLHAPDSESEREPDRPDRAA